MQRDAAHVPFVESGSYPLRGGNAVRPLVDGGPAFRRICEAVEAARRSVWVTVAFHRARASRCRTGAAASSTCSTARGARARRARDLLAPSRAREVRSGLALLGTEAERALLRARGSRFLARWDRAEGRYCQHQKSWLVDAGEPGEVAFVGGINLNPSSVVAPGHSGDARAAARTTCTSRCAARRRRDVHHNFVQRWNEASDRERPTGCGPTRAATSDLRVPASALSPAAGDVPVQIQRTVRRGRYRDGTPAPGGAPFAIARRRALASSTSTCARSSGAQRAIYIEDQAIGAPADRRRAARGARARRRRGRSSCPIDPNNEMAAGRRKPENRAFFESLARARRASTTSRWRGSPRTAAAAPTRTSTCTRRSRSSTTRGARSARPTSATARSSATRS